VDSIKNEGHAPPGEYAFYPGNFGEVRRLARCPHIRQLERRRSKGKETYFNVVESGLGDLRINPKISQSLNPGKTWLR
jgi:hypothetical protein